MRSTEAEIRTHYRTLTEWLIRNKLWITTMESCSAGLIASLITDTEGSSGIMKGAFVTYSNEAKIRQGVPEGIIERYGVYSCETALAMAQACREAYRADIGIGVTGSLGNVDPANADSVPGEVYLAIGTEQKETSVKVMIPYSGSRYLAKLMVAEEVYQLLFRSLNVK